MILSELREIRRLLSLSKEVLTLDEFCLYTGISKGYAYKLTSSGLIKFYRPSGKMIFFDKLDVIAFLKKGAVVDPVDIQERASKLLINNKNVVK